MKKRGRPRGRATDVLPIYIFDITGQLLYAFKSATEFEGSDFFLKWFGVYLEAGVSTNKIRFSTLKNQSCHFCKFFLTHNPNFRVDLYSTVNHNPLRTNKAPNAGRYYQNLSIIVEEPCFDVYYRRVPIGKSVFSDSGITRGTWMYNDNKLHMLCGHVEPTNFEGRLSYEQILNVEILHEKFLKINNEITAEDIFGTN